MSEKNEVLEKLAFDPNDYMWIERYIFARQGKYLSVLVNDISWSIRQEVAKQGYGLDKLIKDENEHVRIAVAEQGYGLDILAYDKDWFIRYKAQQKLKELQKSSLTRSILKLKFILREYVIPLYFIYRRLHERKK